VPLNGRQPVLKTGVGNVSQGFDSSTLCNNDGVLTGQAGRSRLLNAEFRFRNGEQIALAPLTPRGVQFPPPETETVDALKSARAFSALRQLLGLVAQWARAAGFYPVDSGSSPGGPTNLERGVAQW
jgi:hypothetical protein